MGKKQVKFLRLENLLTGERNQKYKQFIWENLSCLLKTLQEGFSMFSSFQGYSKPYAAPFNSYTAVVSFETQLPIPCSSVSHYDNPFCLLHQVLSFMSVSQGKNHFLLLVVFYLTCSLQKVVFIKEIWILSIFVAK